MQGERRQDVYYELYIDVFFLVNFMMDAILLEILRKILGCPVSHGRVLLGAGAGAFGTCVVLCLPVPYGFVRIVASHGLINLIMLKTGFGIRWGREMAKAFLLLYISGFLMGGILSVFRPYLRTAGLFFAFAVISYYCLLYTSFPVCVCGKVSKGSIITRKPILPSEEEMETNSRSKSAKLRIFERC